MRDEQIVKLANDLERFASQHCFAVNDQQPVYDAIEVVLSKISGSWYLDQTTENYVLCTPEEWDVWDNESSQQPKLFDDIFEQTMKNSCKKS